MSEPRDETSTFSRRQFGGISAGLAAGGLASLAAIEAAVAQDAGTSLKPAARLIKPGQTILFQGDSITDAGRKRSDNDPNSQPALGNGYAWLAASEILVDWPDEQLKFFNRGVSGNKVHQLAERWDADCLELKPDVLSILIGVNDFWHKLKHNYDGTLEKYETDYRALVKRTKEALPNVKLVIGEPFALKLGEVDENGKPVGAVDDAWFPEFDGYRAAAKRVAEEAGAVFIPFQSIFDTAMKYAPAKRWAGDGVHPAPDGAALMAHWWMKAVGE
jgi:lysophospholipase L1-like esterase